MALVETPLSLTYEDVLAYPTVIEVVLLTCPGVFYDNAERTGVTVWALVEEAVVKAEAAEVVLQTVESTTPDSGVTVHYSSGITLEEIVHNNSVFLAHMVNRETLPMEHG